jgi:hypothetical protein
MFTITTAHTSNASGRSQVVAKGHGKQRTVSVDFSKSDDYNDGAAVGALLAVLASPEQQAKVRHPSGAQRVRYDYKGTSKVWSIDV